MKQLIGRIVAAGGVVLLGAGLLGACTDSAKKSSSPAMNAASASSAAAAAPAVGAAAGKAVGATPQPYALKVNAAKVAAVPRSVIRTATISVTAADVNAAADKVATIAVGQGGRIDGDDRSGTNHTRVARLIVRVLPDRLETAMTLVGALGKETGRTLQDQDVTQSTVDLAARTAALQTSVIRLRALLSKSANVAALLAVENQLSDRESQLESLEAQKTALAGQVSLATLTVSLRATPAPAVAAKKRSGIHPTGFVSALGSGLHAVGVGIRLVLAGLGYSLPVLVPAGLLVALAWWLRRRSRTGRRVGTPPEPT